VSKQDAAILVDEQFGAAILRDAKAQGYHFACPAEKSGQEEFDFLYGEDFAAHIEAFQPTFCKVLVRYNPKGDAALNRRQAERLSRVLVHFGYLCSAWNSGARSERVELENRLGVAARAVFCQGDSESHR